MNTTMGRFVLLSAVLHAAMLAAVGHTPLRTMQSLPSTLTIALSESPKMPLQAADPFSKDGPSTRPAPAGITKTLHPPQPNRSAAKTSHRNAADVTTVTRQDVRKKIERHSRMIADPPSTSSASQAPVTDGRMHHHNPPQSDNIPTQHVDAARLASQLDGQVRNALVSYFTYPMLARRHGWQGKVEVGLRVEANGRLSHMRIARSSGYRLLDDAALAALHHVIGVPRAAGWLDGHHFDMVLAIDYRLLDDQG